VCVCVCIDTPHRRVYVCAELKPFVIILYLCFFADVDQVVEKLLFLLDVVYTHLERGQGSQCVCEAVFFARVGDVLWGRRGRHKR
jgi:hypothetical protein